MDRGVVVKVLIGSSIVGLSLYVFLAVASYDPRDLPGCAFPTRDVVANACGVTGAVVGRDLLTAFGLGAYLLPLFFLVWGVLFVAGHGADSLGRRILGVTLFLFSLCSLGAAIGGQSRTMPSYGGVIGVACSELLRTYIGAVGLWICGLLGLATAGYLLSLDLVLLATYNAAVALGIVRKPATQSTSEPATAVAPSAEAVAPIRTETESPPDKAKLRIHRPKELLPQEASRPAELPPLSLLEESTKIDSKKQEEIVKANAGVLERALTEFGVDARVREVEIGPVVARYGVELGPGVKVHRVISLSNDLAISLKAPCVRVVAPIPGKSVIGIEVPNPVREIVRLKTVASMPEFQDPRRKLPICLGKDTSGNLVIGDLSTMPHLLIAGATGSGKSVCINSIICGLLLRMTAQDLKFIMIDPKMVELVVYEDIPHLLCRVITDSKKAPWALDWAVQQMDERYELLARAGVRDVESYNALGEKEIRRRLGEDVDYASVPFRLPYIVIVVDELAELMLVAQKEVEAYIVRLSQKSRAVGIHLVTATQRPSVDVITGLIKANLTARIGFRVTAKVDSRTILDRNGADMLLGRGDMLYLPPDQTDLIRIQGTMVSDKERKNIANFVRKQGSPSYLIDLDQIAIEHEEDAPDYNDDLYHEACKVIVQTQRGSVSLLQRKLGIGYTRAARLIDMMAKDGIVGDYKGSKAREVLMTYEEWCRRHGSQPEPVDVETE